MEKILITIFTISLLAIGCTDLNEPVLDTALGGNLLNQSGAAEGVLAPVYAEMDDLFNNQEHYFLLQEVTTDEAIVPFRGGTDWYNGGRLIEMHQHTWTPTHNNIQLVWAQLTQGIAKAAIAENTLARIDSPSSEQYIAEARGMTAFYNSILLDLYGVVFKKNPGLVGTTKMSTVLRSQEAIDYILSELDAIEPDLKDYNAVGSTRFTKGAAWAIKAKLYLNKAVYLDRYASSFNFSKDDMDKVIANCNKIINSGEYALESGNYFNIFDIDNHNHPEIILGLDQRLEANGTNRFEWFALSRNTHGSVKYLTSVGTDGASITSDFYHTWDGHHNDPRFFQRNLPDGGSVSDDQFALNRGLLQGQQYGIIPNEAGTDYQRTSDGKLKIEKIFDTARTGEPVDYTVDVDLKTHNGHSAGVRVSKYEWDPEAQDGKSQGRVDIPLFRLGGIYLMRAEAELRKKDEGSALTDVNMVRDARNAQELTSVNLDSLVNERGFELYWEMHRRTDMIRFGKYEDSWTSKTNSDVTRRLFPIPQSAIDAASSEQGYLEQNKGY